MIKTEKLYIKLKQCSHLSSAQILTVTVASAVNPFRFCIVHLENLQCISWCQLSIVIPTLAIILPLISQIAWSEVSCLNSITVLLKCFRGRIENVHIDKSLLNNKNSPCLANCRYSVIYNMSFCSVIVMYYSWM